MFETSLEPRYHPDTVASGIQIYDTENQFGESRFGLGYQTGQNLDPRRQDERWCASGL